MRLTIPEFQKAIHANAIKKGFFEKEKNIGEMLALIHSEVSEALEAEREDKHFTGSMLAVNGWTADVDFAADYKTKLKGTFEEEMADIVIRVMDLCEFKGIDLEQQIIAKMDGAEWTKCIGCKRMDLLVWSVS